MREIYSETFPGLYLLDIGIDHDLAMLSKTPVNRLADVKGMKIRAGGALGEVLTKAGASATNIPGGELYTALSTGLIDGVIYGTIKGAMSIGLHESAKYCVKDIHGPHFLADYFINEKVWSSLPADLQEVIRLANTKAVYEASLHNYRDNQEKYKEFQMDGGTLIIWPKEDFDTMTQYSIEVMESLAASDANAGRVYNEVVKKILDMR
jgi:TRAP-type mannitol/chloroaromatic compound transport system substrate-binding protein